MGKLKILYHGHCFDGAVSAAIFTRFYRDRVDDAAEVIYRGMAHSHEDPFGPDHDATFDAETNAVLDFRYSPSPRLSWWCDHHHSAFMAPEHRAHFEADDSGRKHFDPGAPSCAGLLWRWLTTAHGFDGAPFEDHVQWADLIDSASFVDARQAVELAEPALQLMALLESGPPAAMTDAMIEALSRGTIAELSARPEIQQALEPVIAKHREMIEAIRAALTVEHGVAYFDIAERALGGFNKFIPYYLADGLRYVVGVTRTATRSKVSVGSNPWQRPDPLINLADQCAAYGGGGHAVVAACSFPPEDLARAREAAGAIAARLRQG